MTASAGSDTIREMAGTDDVIALAFRQLDLAYGGTPRKPDAARNAVLRLPHIDARSTTPHHLQGTALHAVVRYATSDEIADATWRKTPGAERVSRRKFARELVAFILAQGATPDLRDAHHDTALHLASDGDPDILRLLIDHGFDPNATRPDGWTPLMRACGSRRVSAKNVELLLAAGADPKRRLPNGRTAARMLGGKHKEVAKLLAQSSAGPTEAKAPQPSRHPARDARLGNLDALYALVDEDDDGSLAAYKWLCAARDFGHAKASKLASDVLDACDEFDDDGFEQAHAHWELAVAYLEGGDGLPKHLDHARSHLAFAAKLLGRELASQCDAKGVRKRLADDAREVLDGFFPPPRVAAPKTPRKRAATRR